MGWRICADPKLENHSLIIPNIHWQHSFSFVIFAFKSLEGALLCIASQPNLQNFFSKVATFGQSARCHMGRTNLRVIYEVDVPKTLEKTGDQKGEVFGGWLLNKHHIFYLSGFINPSGKKNLVNSDHFPKFRGEKSRMLETTNHPFLIRKETYLPCIQHPQIQSCVRCH